jgi:hypothetical protein
MEVREDGKLCVWNRNGMKITMVLRDESWSVKSQNKKRKKKEQFF